MPDDDRPDYRVEHDSMGEVRVPADAHWGAQTQRAVENFPISGLPIEPALVRALAMIKAEAARVNAGCATCRRCRSRSATRSRPRPTWSRGGTSTSTSRSTCSRPVRARRRT